MSNNEIENIILSRRSVYPKDFIEGTKIPDNIIEEILSLAVWAPTHKLTQPWFFKVYKNNGVATFFEAQKQIYLETTPPEKVTKAKTEKYDVKKNQISHVIVVCANLDEQKRVPEVEEIIATGCVIQNIYLMLKPFGIAGYLSTGDICYTQQMRNFLELENNQECLGFFQLGMPVPELPELNRKRISFEEKTTWITE